jgi:hypothetical protein
MTDDADTTADGDAGDPENATDGPTLVEADPERGFEYPYYLAVPDRAGGERRPIMVEPHNVGGPIEEFERHRELAGERAREGFGRRVADELGAPILVPVFPRPIEEPVDWTHMVHMLCARTMAIEEGPLERVDRQLLAMVEDARERLADRGVSVPADVLLNGFSSAAAFVNRFAALHPDRVRSVTAGGINGLPILPRETADLGELGERPMRYPVGVADVPELTGEPFDEAAFRDLHQFVYMGGDDDKDALLYPDAWTDPELRGIAIFTYGEDVHEERFPHGRDVYEAADVNAVFRTYEGVGHTPEPAFENVVAFHERSLAGEEIESIRADLGGNV